MKTAIYAGTFDPITFGHIDIIERASTLFEHVIVAVATSARKQPTLALETRLELVNQLIQMDNVTVKPMDGLLVDFARQHKASVILRGLRAVSDFDFEFQLYGMNQKMAPEIETVFLPASEGVTSISSTLVKEIISMGGDASAFAPQLVIESLLTK